MSEDKVAVTELEKQMRAWIDDHTRRYLQSGGTDGHILDTTMLGGYAMTQTLLLRTTGRKSGQLRYSPLIYGCIDGAVVIIASRGGADFHPAWYLNLENSGEVEFQIGGQAFRGPWRAAEGAEREDLWAFMRRIYPPYDAYRERTDRHIPLLLLTVREQIDPFREKDGATGA